MDSDSIKENALRRASVLLTYKDAATLLGISVRTLQRYIANNQLQAIAFTRRTKRILLGELEAFIQRTAEQLDEECLRPPGQLQMSFDFLRPIESEIDE